MVSSGLAGLSRGVMILLSALLALATVITQLAQELGWSFRSYAITLALISGCVIVALARVELAGSFARLRANSATATVLALACIATATLTVSSYHELVDDFSYIPNVVYYIAHPDTAMSHVVHFVSGRPRPIESYCVGTSMPFEYAQGVVAYFTGVHVLSVYFVLAPAIFGALIPLVWYYTLTRFEFSDWAATFGAVLICLSLTLMGDAHRTFGNYAFNRLWQGKAVAMTYGLPLIIGLSIDFLRVPSVRHWLNLFVTATALAGISTSSIVLLPLLAPVLALASVIGLEMHPRKAIARVLAYGMSFAYVAGFGLALLMIAAGDLSTEDPISKGFADDFFGQLRYVFPALFPTTRLLLLVGCVGAMGLLRGWQWRFFTAWLGLVVLAYLNSFVAPWLLEHLTPPTLYWRLFYLLPFPLAIGLAGACLAERTHVGASWRGNAVAATIVALMIAAHIPARPTSMFRRGMPIGIGFNPEADALLVARGLIDASPPGPMLAPSTTGGRVTLLSGNRPQICTREYALALWFTSRGERAEAALRRDASDFLRTRRPVHGLNSVMELLRRHPRIQSVVARAKDIEKTSLVQQLATKGFTVRHPVPPFEVFTRPLSADQAGGASG